MARESNYEDFSSLEDDEKGISISSMNTYNAYNNNNNESKENISKEELERLKKVWEKYPKVEQPQDLKLELFPHQLVTVYKMELLERTRRVKVNDSSYYTTDFGILGDIPGYGKSMSIISLILRDKMSWDITKYQEDSSVNVVNSSVKFVTKLIKRRVRANLLVVSPTLIEQWKEYLDFVKENKLKIIEISLIKDIEEFNPNDWDIVLVSSTRYNSLIDKIGNVVWKRFIFDEAGSTHISAMRTVYAGFTWLVTATYRQLLSISGTNKHYLKLFFNHFTSDILRYFVIKNPIEFVRYSFKMPDVKDITHICLNPRVLNILSSYIDAETQVMLAAGDVKGAICRLGGASTTENNLFEIVSKRQKEKIKSAKFSLEFWESRNPAAKEIEIWNKKIKELEKTLNELEEKYKNVLNDDCTICYSTIEGPVLIPCCQNIFCGKCIMKWLESKKTCPMCRTLIVAKDMIYVNKGVDEENKKCDEKEEKRDNSLEIMRRPKQKQETVRDIIIEGLRQNKRFLIFSMYDESFYIIRRELAEHRIDFVEICGTKAMRDSKIKKFKEGKVNVVFLNSKFNGAGINLEMATDIILYHEMPPSIREQVIGRALRIGRKDMLTVHNLIFSN